MRTIVLALSLLLPILIFGQCDPETFGKLKAEVSGDTVVLKNDTVFRNCCVLYHMEVSFKSSDTLIWVQKDMGDICGCMCHFNLSVTIDSLKPGNYIAKTYYTWPLSSDSCYVGSIMFSITEPNPNLSLSVIDHVQSDCFYVGIREDQQSIDNYISVFPNPARDYLTINTNLAGEKTIRIFDVNGKSLIEFKTIKNENKIDIGKLPKLVYFISVSNTNRIVYSKFIRN